MLYFYAIIAYKSFSNWETESAQLEKYFSQLGNYFFAVKWSRHLNIYAKAFVLLFSCFSCSYYR